MDRIDVEAPPPRQINTIVTEPYTEKQSKGYFNLQPDTTYQLPVTQTIIMKPVEQTARMPSSDTTVIIKRSCCDVGKYIGGTLCLVVSLGFFGFIIYLIIAYGIRGW